MLSNHPSVLGSGASGATTSAATSASLDLISTTQGAMLYRNATVWVALDPGTAGQLLSTQGAAANPIWVSATGGAGNVSSGAATDNAIVRYDGISGETVQNSAVTIADTTGAMTWATGQAATLTGGSSGASLVLGSGANAGVTVAGTGTGATATGVNTGGLRSANFGLSTVSGGASYFGGAIRGSGDIQAGATSAFIFGSGVTTYLVGTSSGNAFDVYANSTKAMAVTGSSVNIPLTTSASSSTVGALTVGNGTAATNVAIGGGNINAGGTGMFAGDVTITKAGSDATLTISGGVASYAIAKFNPNTSTTNNFAILAETGGVVYFQQNNGAITPLRFSATGAATFAGAVTTQGLFYPQQATTAGAPAYVKGAIYFDTTLNKLRVGGASAWETITSV